MVSAIPTQEKRTRTTGWTRRLIHRATKHENAKKDAKRRCMLGPQEGTGAALA